MGDKWFVAISGICGGLLGAVLTVAGQYGITYKLIENPKIELQKKELDIEAQRVTLDAQKQFAALVPIVNSVCKSIAIDNWTWRIDCESKNEGLYIAHIKVERSDIGIGSEQVKMERYTEKSGYFNVSFPDAGDNYLLQPTTTGSTVFYIKFDEKKYPGGIAKSDLVAVTPIDFETPSNVWQPVVDLFPSLKGLAVENSKGSINMFTLLTPFVSPPEVPSIK